jgi:hypothetical protein
MASQSSFGTPMSKSMRNIGTEAGFSHLVGAEVPFRTPGSVAWMTAFPHCRPRHPRNVVGSSEQSKRTYSTTTSSDCRLSGLFSPYPWVFSERITMQALQDFEATAAGARITDQGDALVSFLTDKGQITVLMRRVVLERLFEQTKSELQRIPRSRRRS